MKNYIHHNIRYLIHKENLSNYQFAEKFKISTGSLSNYLAEKSKPSLDLLCEISKTYDISLDDLCFSELGVSNIFIDDKKKPLNKNEFVSIINSLKRIEKRLSEDPRYSRLNFNLKDGVFKKKTG